MGDNQRRHQLERPPLPRHVMEVANIRVREAFHRLRQFAVQGHDPGLLDVGLVLRDDMNAIRVQQNPNHPQQDNNPPIAVAAAAAAAAAPVRHEVDIQVRLVREDGENLVPVPLRTPKVPKTVLISGAGQVGVFWEVVVSKVISPSMFWIKPVASIDELKNLERQMAVFYEDEHSPFRDPNFFIEEGAYSGGYYAFYSRSQRCWVRAICGYDGVLVTRNTSVSMYLLDHGKVEHVPATSIRPLQPSFCKLPAQGLMAAFWGESHDATPNRWSPETCLTFRSHLLGRKLQVAIIKKCSNDFPSRFSRAEVVFKESPHSNQVITGWNSVERCFLKTPAAQLAYSLPMR